jgi:cytochrome c oxidase cbb3-type subunit III
VTETTADVVVPGDAPAEARVMTHAYDGIREYDNPLPGWWRMAFYGTIVFAGFYALYFHVVGWGHTPDETYRSTLAAYDEKKDVREAAELSAIDEPGLQEKARDGKVLARGKELFGQRCASCHGPEGAGLIGPNLTDGRQLHGSSRLDIYRTVRGGVPGTAMIAWGEQMAGSDVVAATVFAISLRGTNVAGKGPEGLPVERFAP